MSKSTSTIVLACFYSLFREFLLKVKGQCLRTKRPGNFKTQSIVNIYCIFRATAKLGNYINKLYVGRGILRQGAIF